MSDNKTPKAWYEIAKLSDLSDVNPGDIISLDLEEDNGVKRSIALIRYSDGLWYAIHNACTHDNGPLDDGSVDIDSCAVECARHGAQFALKTGEALRMPAIDAIQTYPLKIEAEIIYIQI